jgi:RecA-family ATPase
MPLTIEEVKADLDYMPVTLDKLMKMELPEPKEIIPGLLFEGASLFAGRPKLGKSWAALGISLAIATGGYVFGKIKVEAGPVLYLALEDSLRRLQSRAATLGDNFPQNLHLLTKAPRMDEGGLELLETWLKANPGARLICIDTWVKFRPVKRVSNDDYTEDSIRGADLQALALQYGVAIVLIHHVRKMPAEDFLDTVSGSVGLTGSCDTIMVLDRKRQEAGAELMVTGRDIDEAIFDLKFDKECGTWAITSDVKVKSVTVSEERGKILEFLGQHPDTAFTPKAISDATGLSHGSVKHLLRKLAAQDKVTSDGKGGYRA